MYRGKFGPSHYRKKRPYYSRHGHYQGSKRFPAYKPYGKHYGHNKPTGRFLAQQGAYFSNSRTKGAHFSQTVLSHRQVEFDTGTTTNAYTSYMSFNMGTLTEGILYDSDAASPLGAPAAHLMHRYYKFGPISIMITEPESFVSVSGVSVWRAFSGTIYIAPWIPRGDTLDALHAGSLQHAQMRRCFEGVRDTNAVEQQPTAPFSLRCTQYKPKYQVPFVSTTSGNNPVNSFWYKNGYIPTFQTATVTTVPEPDLSTEWNCFVMTVEGSTGTAFRCQLQVKGEVHWVGTRWYNPGVTASAGGNPEAPSSRRAVTVSPSIVLPITKDDVIIDNETTV